MVASNRPDSKLRCVNASLKPTKYDRCRRPHTLLADVNSKSVRVDWLSDELRCGICEKLMQNVMVVRNCLHRFCADCIAQKLQNGTKKCPVCKKVFPVKAPFRRDAKFNAIIDKFTSSSTEKRCLKKSIAEYGSLTFVKKRRKYDKNLVSELFSVEIMNSSRSGRSPKQVSKSRTKFDDSVDSIDISRESKFPTANTECNNNSISNLLSDKLSKSDSILSVQQPSTSKVTENGDADKNNSELRKMQTVLNDKVDKARKKLVDSPKGNQESNSSLSSRHSGKNTEPLNGTCTNSVKTSAPGRGIRSMNPPSVIIHHHPGSLIANASDCEINSEGHKTICQGAAHKGNKTDQNTETNKIEELTLPALQSGNNVEGLLLSPRLPDYIFMHQKSRLSPGLDSELVLYPDFSVINNQVLPVAAKRPRFIATRSSTTVGHLREFLFQRIMTEMRLQKFADQCVIFCPVRTDLAINDVLVVSETGEGQFTTMNVREDNADPDGTSVFTISSPFFALDEAVTVDKLKSENWTNKKRPLKLIYKFV